MSRHEREPQAMRRTSPSAAGPAAGRGRTGPDRSGAPAGGGASQDAAKIGYGGAAVLTALAVLISLLGYGLYLKLDGNLNVVNPFAGLRHRPPAPRPGC